jgi:hypothetical protein
VIGEPPGILKVPLTQRKRNIYDNPAGAAATSPFWIVRGSPIGTHVGGV